MSNDHDLEPISDLLDTITDAADRDGRGTEVRAGGTGAAAGAILGGLLGGPVGAAIGGALGGVLGYLAGAQIGNR